jgi:hypothetical protein
MRVTHVDFLVATAIVQMLKTLPGRGQPPKLIAFSKDGYTTVAKLGQTSWRDRHLNLTCGSYTSRGVVPANTD